MKRLALIAEVALRLIIVEAGLRIVRPKALIARLSRRRGTHALPVLAPIVMGLERRLFGGSSCLRGALTIFWMAGAEARLHLGIATKEEAHAWVEHDGAVFPAHTRPAGYVPLAAFGKTE